VAIATGRGGTSTGRECRGAKRHSSEEAAACGCGQFFDHGGVSLPLRLNGLAER
jgi:hypothetical protein